MRQMFCQELSGKWVPPRTRKGVSKVFQLPLAYVVYNHHNSSAPMSSEKPTTKILTGVAIAILGPFALYLCRKWLIPIWDLFWGGVVSVWNWILASHAIPGWLIIILFITALWCSIKIAVALLALGRKPGQPRPPREPHWMEFTVMEFEG